MRCLTLRSGSFVPLAMFSFYALVENHEWFIKTTSVLEDGQNRAALHLIILILLLHFSLAELGFKPKFAFLLANGAKSFVFFFKFLQRNRSTSLDAAELTKIQYKSTHHWVANEPEVSDELTFLPKIELASPGWGEGAPSYHLKAIPR